MTKHELFKKFLSIVKDYEAREKHLATCLVLRDLKVNKDVQVAYKEWLKISPYFKKDWMGVITVNLSYRDYTGKVRMFYEFLNQYEGEFYLER